MNGASTSHLAYTHATRLRDTFIAHGFTVEQVEQADTYCWQLAASVALIPQPTDEVKTRTVASVREALEHPDPFVAFEGVGF